MNNSLDLLDVLSTAYVATILLLTGLVGLFLLSLSIYAAAMDQRDKWFARKLRFFLESRRWEGKRQ